jgi:hypothetical protein
MKMAVQTEDIKVLEKVVNLARNELNPVEYARFLAMITPKSGDSVKQLRELRDKEKYVDIINRLKKRGVMVTP